MLACVIGSWAYNLWSLLDLQRLRWGIYLVREASVVLQNVVLFASNGQGNLLGSGEEVGHLGVRELVEELGVVYIMPAVKDSSKYILNRLERVVKSLDVIFIVHKF